MVVCEIQRHTHEHTHTCHLRSHTPWHVHEPRVPARPHGPWARCAPATDMPRHASYNACGRTLRFGSAGRGQSGILNRIPHYGIRCFAKQRPVSWLVNRMSEIGRRGCPSRNYATHEALMVIEAPGARAAGVLNEKRLENYQQLRGKSPIITGK